MRRFWIGWIAGLVTAALAAWAVPYSGIINMEASGPPGLLDQVGAVAFERSLSVRAPDVANPLTNPAAAREKGLDEYGENCVFCHGAPGVDPLHFVHGMQPQPPDLWRGETQEMSDGQLFRVVKHGVRMTGMPAFGNHHSDSEIWAVVSFLRHLDSISAEERHKLSEVVEPPPGTEAHHHEHEASR